MISRISHDESFSIEKYFPAIIAEFKLVGRDVEITKKEKKGVSNVESAFLKDDTHTYDLSFKTEKALKIKIEVDVNPTLGFSTEQKLLLQPFSFMTKCFTLPDLYAGKMHALVFRNWKLRVKGRDWYDFEWYVRKGIALDFNRLAMRTKEFSGTDITKEQFQTLLKERLSSTNIAMVKRDVEPFIKNYQALGIWSNDYFL